MTLVLELVRALCSAQNHRINPSEWPVTTPKNWVLVIVGVYAWSLSLLVIIRSSRTQPDQLVSFANGTVILDDKRLYKEEGHIVYSFVDAKSPMLLPPHILPPHPPSSPAFVALLLRLPQYWQLSWWPVSLGSLQLEFWGEIPDKTAMRQILLQKAKPDRGLGHVKILDLDADLRLSFFRISTWKIRRRALVRR